jgi:magnesium transporter
MSEAETVADTTNVQDRLERQLNEVHELLREDNRERLREELAGLHPADTADLLEALPLVDRLAVWHFVPSEQDGEILLEVSDAVRASLIERMGEEEILAAIKPMDADELADLADELPPDVLPELMASLGREQQERVQSALSYPEDQVGALMDFEMVTIREDVTLEVVLRYIRRFETLPDQTDKLFVVNHENVLTGVLPIDWLLINQPERKVGEVMTRDVNTFSPEDDAGEAAAAFERYDLVSAPVVDAAHRLIGRLTIDVMVDYIRESSAQEALERVGLREEEDIFSSVWSAVRNRWAWLAVNLITAFLATRVISVFEGTIEKIVVLATLFPIVAGVSGNSGNQTITMIVRAMALKDISLKHAGRLWRKELGAAAINGLIWGAVIGVVVWAIYGNIALGLVMVAAMALNLVLGAFMGVAIPMTMSKFGRDPALGSSVLITFCTDSGGFFIVLALATLFLLH